MNNRYFHVGRDSADNVKMVYPNGVRRDLCDRVVAWFDRHHVKSVTVERPFLRLELSNKVSVYASNGEIRTPSRWHVAAKPEMNDMEVADLVSELQWIRDIDDGTLAALVEIYDKL